MTTSLATGLTNRRKGEPGNSTASAPHATIRIRSSERLAMSFTRPNGQAIRRPPGESSARIVFLQNHRDPMAWEQLFSSLQGLGLISSEDRHHGDVLGQVSYYVEQQAHGWCGGSWRIWIQLL